MLRSIGAGVDVGAAPPDLAPRTLQPPQPQLSSPGGRGGSGGWGGSSPPPPTLLFRPICGYCCKLEKNRLKANELVLGHSGKYSSVNCLAGLHGRDGCRINGYKSVRIIETCLLDFFQQQVLDDQAIAELTKSANAFLAEEASKPGEDVDQLKKELTRVRARRAKLAKALDFCKEAKLPEIVAAMEECQEADASLSRRLEEAKRPQTEAVKPLSVDNVKSLLSDFRQLVSSDVKAAAPILRQLFGPITIKVKKLKGQQKPVWFAHFRWNYGSAMTAMSEQTGSPIALCLEFLEQRNWTHFAGTASVELHQATTAQKWAATVQAMLAHGRSVKSVATATGLAWEQVRDAQQCTAPAARKFDPQEFDQQRSCRPNSKYIRHAARVKRLWDDDGLNYSEIAAEIRKETGESIARGTVARALNYACRDQVVANELAGEKPPRRVQRSIKPPVIKRMRKMLKQGKLPKEVANALGCGKSTVERKRQAMRRDGTVVHRTEADRDCRHGRLV